MVNGIEAWLGGCFLRGGGGVGAVEKEIAQIEAEMADKSQQGANYLNESLS